MTFEALMESIASVALILLCIAMVLFILLEMFMKIAMHRFAKYMIKNTLSDEAFQEAEHNVLKKVNEIISSQSVIEYDDLEDQTLKDICGILKDNTIEASNIMLSDVFGLSAISDEEYESMLRHNPRNVYIGKGLDSGDEIMEKANNDKSDDRFEVITTMNPSTYSIFVVARRFKDDDDRFDPEPIQKEPSLYTGEHKTPAGVTDNDEYVPADGYAQMMIHRMRRQLQEGYIDIERDNTDFSKDSVRLLKVMIADYARKREFELMDLD